MTRFAATAKRLTRMSAAVCYWVGSMVTPASWARACAAATRGPTLRRTVMKSILSRWCVSSATRGSADSTLSAFTTLIPIIPRAGRERTSRRRIGLAFVHLLAQLSPAAAIPALVLVVNATHLLYIQWRVKRPPLETPRDSGLFATAQLPERHFIRDFGPGLAISFTVQTGVCAMLLHHAVLAGLSFAAGTAQIGRASCREECRSRRSP